MFSGLNNFVKYILPKRLFYRALIIVAAPTIILQIIITIVFYDSIWIKANKSITRSLVAQLKAIEEVYQNDKTNLDFLTDSYKNNFNFEIGINQEFFPNNSGERRFSPMDRSLRRELKSTFGNNNYWFNTSKFKNAVEIKIRSNNDVIEFLVPKEMVSASSVRLFVLWTTLPSLVLLIIDLIFLKNQTKPLVKLAKAAERFGKGDYVNDFRASGSQEIRKAAFEFDRMEKRINRHINQRAEMLSGISHDLRTPITRLKLGLSFLPKEQREPLEKDVEDMNLLLNEFLDFAHKIVSPGTYNCNLCAISYGNFSMKKKWSDYISSLPVKTTFTYKDKVSEYGYDSIKLPSIIFQDKSKSKVIISSEEINKLKKIDQLINILSDRLRDQGMSIEKQNKNDLSEQEWKEKLTPEEYNILREKGTERPFTGEYDKF